MLETHQVAHHNDLATGLDEVARALVDEQVEVVLEDQAVVVGLVWAVAIGVKKISFDRQRPASKHTHRLMSTNRPKSHTVVLPSASRSFISSNVKSTSLTSGYPPMRSDSASVAGSREVASPSSALTGVVDSLLVMMAVPWMPLTERQKKEKKPSYFSITASDLSIWARVILVSARRRRGR